ncbi:MAG: hypothetical protein BMS9Abin26_1195 [Gammaproteobacteria bacterium]|nr:MAG: hypothetical protein BMS9Abin26_1195 [Gammaproteobacteria bacterium]
MTAYKDPRSEYGLNESRATGIHLLWDKRVYKLKIVTLISVLVILAVTGSGCSSESAAQADVPSARSWQRSIANPLIIPRLTRMSQDFGPADPTVLYDETDRKWKVWFSSTLKDRSSGKETMSIKYADSSDGVHWSEPRITFQVSADPGAWDHTHTETPAVIRNPDPGAPNGQKFMLWYSGANTRLTARQSRPNTFPYYQIGLAYSADGKSFTRHRPGLDNQPGLVLVANASIFGKQLPGRFGDGLLADPEVLFHDGRFHMWFSSYAESVPVPASVNGRSPLAFGISHASSLDGVTWVTGHDNPLRSLSKPGEIPAGQQPSVLFNPSSRQFEMWFSNDTDQEKAGIPCSFNMVSGFWHAVSDDGIQWRPNYSRRDLHYSSKRPYESLGFLTGVEVVLIDGIYNLFYSGWGTAKIPGKDLYWCPDHKGKLIPAVLTLNRATYTLR